MNKFMLGSIGTFTIISATLIFLFFSTASKAQVTTPNYYTQGNNNRTAAEWEPALGTMITWPLAIPHQLVIELANDNHLYTLVQDTAAQTQAQAWFATWGIPTGKVTFIIANQGEYAWWTRDWGPSAVFDRNKHYNISNGKFVFGSPLSGLSCNDTLVFELDYDQNGNLIQTTEEDAAPTIVANQLGYPVLDLPFINTGGNACTDGLETALSTCILLNENNYYGVNQNDFRQWNDSLLGFKNYHILSNYEQNGIQHIDCFMKIINEETLLVAQPPSNHAMSSVYENIVQNELSQLTTSYGRPYKIERIQLGRYQNEDLAAYTNSLIINKNIYVPLFNIPEDQQALATWRRVMPGYTVKGFTYSLSSEPVVTSQITDLYSYGWNYGDALHCRTRAIWDPEMLFITAKKVNSVVLPTDSNKVHTTIINYKGNGLNNSQCKIFWRVKGQSNWNDIVLSQTADPNQFFAKIPHHQLGDTVEYYVQAVSSTGKVETHPRTAPIGFHSFTIQNTVSVRSISNYSTDVRLYPNPTLGDLTLEIDLPEKQPLVLSIYSTNGQQVKTINNINIPKTTLNISELNTGLYFFQLRNKDRIISRGKIIIE